MSLTSMHGDVFFFAVSTSPYPISGKAHDRCLFSWADLVVAKRVAYFGQPVFYFMHHVLVNKSIDAAIKKFLQLRRERGLTMDTHAAREEAEDMARLLHGNVWDVPLFAMEVTIGHAKVSLQSHLKDALVVPPIMHIQVCGLVFFFSLLGVYESVFCNCS
jgi:hypothetical protein